MIQNLPISQVHAFIQVSGKKLVLITGFLLLSILSMAQVLGDYRSVASGNWNAPSTWQYYNGSTWVAATNYPGQVANSSTVTISTGDVVTLNVDVIAYSIAKLLINGSGRLNLSGNTTRQLNALAIIVNPDGIYMGPNFSFASAQSALRLTGNSYIDYPAGYAAFPTSNASPNGSCNNNNALYLGGGAFGGSEVKYSACNGGGNVCVLFDDINRVGGTINVTPEIILTSEQLGFGNISCQSSFDAFVRIKGVIAAGEVALNLTVTPSGSVSPSTLLGLTDGGALDMGPAGDQQILVKVSVTTPGPGTYSLNASATVTLIAATGNCTNFTSTSTSSASFTVVPTPSVSTSTSTAVCLGDSTNITLSNNSSIATNVYYNINGGSEMVVMLDAMGSGSIKVPGATVGNFVYTLDSIKYTTVPSCRQNIATVYSISVAASSGLAIDDDMKTQNIVLKPLVTTSPGCRIIAKVEKNIAATFTSVASHAYVDMPYLEYNSTPYAARRVMLDQTSGSGGATLTLYALPSEFVAFNTHPNHGGDLPASESDVANYGNIRVIQYSDGSYDAVTGMPTGSALAEFTPTSVVYNSTNNWWEISVNVSSADGLFIISNQTFVILPLKLLTFDAKLSGKNTAALSWKTAEEKDLRSFEIEVAKDGRLFTKVGEVTATNSLLGGTYNFNTSMPGKLGYFRLRMIDRNGAYSYSNIRVLKTDKLVITSYPNPVRSQMTVDLTGYPAGTMRVIDMNGRTVATYKTVDGINRINTSSLGAGIYMLQVHVGLETEMLKFNKIQP